MGFSARPIRRPSSTRRLGTALHVSFQTRKNFRTYTLVSPRRYQFRHPSKRKPVNGLGENEPLTIQSRTPTQSVHTRSATIPRRVGARRAAYADSRLAALGPTQASPPPSNGGPRKPFMPQEYID